MIWITPGYYKEFTCTASACEDNCCEGGWQIGIDDETAEYYRTVPGEFGEELRAALDCTDEYCFRLKNGACPLLDEHKLCRVYQELGVEHMGVVCDQFPRYTEYFGAVKETGIGLACEEAARIVLENDAFTCTQEEIDEEIYEDSELEPELYAALALIRDRLLAELSLTNRSFQNCVSAFLAIAREVQELVNEDDLEALSIFADELSVGDLDEWTEDMNLEAENLEVEGSVDEAMTNLWLAFEDLEPLGELWGVFYERVLHAHEDAVYERNPYPRECALEPQWKRLLAYYIFRYFTASCYSHNPLGAAQFAVVNLLAMRDWMQACEEGGEEPLELLKKILHLYSREVEYSKDNVELLMENFLFDEVFDPVNLNNLVQKLF